MRLRTGDRYSLRFQGVHDKVHMPSTRGGVIMFIWLRYLPSRAIHVRLQGAPDIMHMSSAQGVAIYTPSVLRAM